MGGALPPCRKESGSVWSKCDSRTTRSLDLRSELTSMPSAANSSSNQPLRSAMLKAVGTGQRVYQMLFFDMDRSLSREWPPSALLSNQSVFGGPDPVQGVVAEVLTRPSPASGVARLADEPRIIQRIGDFSRLSTRRGCSCGAGPSSLTWRARRA